MARTDLTGTPIPEQTTAWYSGTLKDRAGAAIASASLTTLTATLYAPGYTAGSNIVNSRSAQNVLNANNCTLHATSGLFEWEIQPADTTMLTTESTAFHILLLQWTSASVGNGKHEVLFLIQALEKIA